MTRSFLSVGLIVLLGLQVAACNRGLRDSLVLTGLRGKPDESKIVLSDELTLPPDDSVVVPGSTTAASARPVGTQGVTRAPSLGTSSNAGRSDVFVMHKILFGEELAEQEEQRQAAIQQQNALSIAEQQLLRSVRGRPEFNAQQQAPTTQPAPEGRRRLGFSLPKLLPF